MRQKELRIALVCYGGVSLAVYMHGVTKEIWHLTRASRASHADEPSAGSSEAVYRALIDRIAETQGLHLRVLPDILPGASAGGINAVRSEEHTSELQPLMSISYAVFSLKTNKQKSTTDGPH